MKKFLALSLVAAVALVSGLFAPTSAEAVPAFARQTGTACFACHYQVIPQLNGFGRSFKLGGMSQTSQETIKDEGMDITPNINAAVMIGTHAVLGQSTGSKSFGLPSLATVSGVLTAGGSPLTAGQVTAITGLPGFTSLNQTATSLPLTSFQTLLGALTPAQAALIKPVLANLTSNINGNNIGNVQIGDDASLFVGGRVGNDMGALVEISSDPGVGNIFANTKFVFSHDFGGIQAGASLYRTAGGGPMYSMDLWNTGSNQNNFGWDGGKDVFLNLQAPGNSNAEGLSLFAGSGLWFVNAGLYAPVTDNLNQVGGAGANVGLNLSQYFRVAITPTVGGMDLMVGVQGTSGTTIVDQGGLNLSIDTQSFAVDAQAQFELAGQPAQITAAFTSLPGITKNNTNTVNALTLLDAVNGSKLVTAYGGSIYNPGTNNESGFQATGSWNINKMIGVKLAYASITNVSGGSFNLSAVGVGVYASIAQNVRLLAEDFMYSGDTGLTKLAHDSSTATIGFKYYF